jgi:uncharacterized protein
MTFGLPRLNTRFTIPAMKTTFRILLAVLLFGAPCLTAQTAAANSKPADAAPQMKTWFLHLIPPRPTFDKDATPAEQALMEQHLQYWKDLFDKGICVFGDPVLDPRGVYGVLAIRAASEEEARAMADGDPSVKAGVNRMEVAEMRIIFLPGNH